MFDLKQLDKLFNDTNLNSKLASDEVALRQHKRKTRTVKIIFPAVAAALIGLLAVFPSLKEHTDFSIQIDKPHTITDKSNRVNTFTAETVDETETGSQIFKIQNPHGKMPTSDEQSVDITAPIGYYDRNTKIFSLNEIVNINYSDGMTAQTTKAFYDSNLSMAYGNSPLSAEGKYGTLQTQGFEYYTDSEKAILKGKTDIHAAAEAFGEKTDIYARDKVEIYRAEQKLKAFGQAVMTRPNLKVSADVLTAAFVKNSDGKATISEFSGDGNVIVDNGKNTVRADKLKTFFKNGNNRDTTIDRIEMTGNVKTETADGNVYASKGTYYPDSGLVKLFEDVTIVKNGNSMHGSYAETNLNTGVSKMQSGGKHRVSGVIFEDSLKKNKK